VDRHSVTKMLESEKERLLKLEGAGQARLGQKEALAAVANACVARGAGYKIQMSTLVHFPRVLPALENGDPKALAEFPVRDERALVRLACRST